jgi:hypothetical protein
MNESMRRRCFEARLADINTRIPQDGDTLRRANTAPTNPPQPINATPAQAPVHVPPVNKVAYAPAPATADAHVRVRGNTDYIPGRTDYAIAYNTVTMGITRGDIRCTHDEAMLLVPEYLRIKSMRVSLKALRELVIANPDMAEEYMSDIEGLEVMVEIAYGKMAMQGWSMPR